MRPNSWHTSAFFTPFSISCDNLTLHMSTTSAILHCYCIEHMGLTGALITLVLNSVTIQWIRQEALPNTTFPRKNRRHYFCTDLSYMDHWIDGVKWSGLDYYVPFPDKCLCTSLWGCPQLTNHISLSCDLRPFFIHIIKHAPKWIKSYSSVQCLGKQLCFKRLVLIILL
jgi:hypothetical protein